jgi:SAM-dependent methyltransferase
VRRHALASADYRVLNGPDEARLRSGESAGWLSYRTALRQDRAFRRLIKATKRGQARIDIAIAAEAVAATEITNARLIEVGCGGGYYSEAFDHLLPDKLQYTGADYSEASIRCAKRHYQMSSFCVADATRLPFADSAFDIVFNGAALMHMVDHEAAICEAARISCGYCIFHNVPIFRGHQTTYLRKYAYGAPVIEIVFCEEELISMCKSAGLHLVRQWTGLPYDVSHATGHASCAETFLFAAADRPGSIPQSAESRHSR